MIYTKKYLMDTLEILSCKKKYNRYVVQPIIFNKKEVYTIHILLNDLWWCVARHQQKGDKIKLHKVYKNNNTYSIEFYNYNYADRFTISIDTICSSVISAIVTQNYYYYTIDYNLDKEYAISLHSNIVSWFKKQNQ